MIGETVSHFRILAELGQGGMGEVYRAEDSNLGRQVAIKFLPTDRFDDEEAIERFRREARAASALNHPHICTICDLGEHQGKPFLVMELLEGETLRERMGAGRLGLEWALRLADQVADALAVAHAREIVHRDIKPENLFITQRGDTKVLDFGLAQEMTVDEDEETLTQLTREGSTVGTLAYMAPEQILSKPLDGRTDIFSLGVVLYEMLTGNHPFRRGQSMQTADAILHHEIVSVDEGVLEIPRFVARVLERMLAKDPGARYQSFEAVRADLAAGEAAVPFKEQDRGAGRRKQLIGVGMAAGAIVFAVGLGRWVSRSHQSETPPSPTSENTRPPQRSASVTPTAAFLGDVAPNSVAVLPFRNLSPDRNNDYFAEGSTLWWTYYDLAQIEALQGNRVQAYELLERAVDAGATSYVVYRNDPCFAQLHDEDRFQRLMAEIEQRIGQMRFRVRARQQVSS